MTNSPFSFPDGRTFAFSIFDDTDVATLDYIRPVYELLRRLGFRTTKSVWTLPWHKPCDDHGSDTLDDPDYLLFVQELQRQGFEIAFHGASMVSSQRATTSAALEIFREKLGHYPATYAAHAQNRENLYWGRDRLRFRVWKWLYAALQGRGELRAEGHRPDSQFFWADLAATRIRYMRSFTYDELNLWNITSEIPYRTAGTPEIYGYFPSAFADNVEEFIELLSSDRISALERDKGLCIVGTHFGKGFLRNGQVHPGVEEALTRLSARPGWFPTVSTLLDYLAMQRGEIALLRGLRLFLLEGKWFLHGARSRKKRRNYEGTERAYLQRAVEGRAVGANEKSSL